MKNAHRHVQAVRAETVLLEGTPKKRTRYHYLWIIGVCIYLTAIWYVGWDRFSDAFLNLRPVALLWVAATLLASIWLRVLKWRLALDTRPTTQLYFMSKAGGELTPSRVGELSPLLLQKFRTPRVAAWIVVDRLIEIAATLAYGAFGAFMLRSSRSGLLPMVGAASVLFVVLPVFLITRRRLFLWIKQRAAERGLTHRAASFLAEVSGEVWEFRTRVFIAAWLTLLTTGLDIFSGVLIYNGFGQHLSFALVAAAQCMHGIISAIPFLPNVTGVPYVAAGVLVNQVGGVPIEVIAAVVAVHVLLSSTLFWGSLGISAWRWGGGKDEG